MATVVQPIIEPDVAAIKTHLAILFAPCVEHYPQGLIELRHGPQFKSAYFGIHTQGLHEAAEFAADRARAGSNVYVGVNPRRPQTDLKHAATAQDVEVSFFHFADLDDGDAVAAAGRRLKALPPTFTVTTGTVPHRRPHFYWKLEEPVANLTAWTERQQGIAQSLDGDKVIDPPRIMRLAGTVNWPDQKKLQRGYKAELVTLKTEFEDERGAVTPEQVTAAFPVQKPDYVSDEVRHGETTLSAMRQTQIADLIAACRNGDQWHNNMIRLVAHLAAKGRTSAEIVGLAEHITLPGYSADQTRREMATALQGARSKWALPEPEVETVEAEERVREGTDSIFELLDVSELENMPPPTWLIRDLVAEEGLTILYGDPGAGKSFIAIDMALRVAHGMNWHGTEAKPTGVLYIAGEGARGIGKRIKGWRREHGMESVDAPFLLLPVAVQLLEPQQRAKLIRTVEAAVQRAGFKIGLIVIDTVSRALAGADENGQEAMSAFVAACDEVRATAGGAVIGVHHSGKDKDRGMRGSTVLLGACDASLRVTKSEHMVTLKTEKQKDAEEAAPIQMEMRKVSWATGLEEEQTTLVPFRSDASVLTSNERITNAQIVRAFGMMADAWGNQRPLSHRPETRKDGRYAPRIFVSQIGGTAEEWAALLASWLETECLAYDTCDSRMKKMGLRVLNVPGVVE